MNYYNVLSLQEFQKNNNFRLMLWNLKFDTWKSVGHGRCLVQLISLMITWNEKDPKPSLTSYCSYCIEHTFSKASCPVMNSNTQKRVGGMFSLMFSYVLSDSRRGRYYCGCRVCSLSPEGGSSLRYERRTERWTETSCAMEWDLVATALDLNKTGWYNGLGWGVVVVPIA